MEERTIQIRCRNNGKTLEVPVGANLQEVYKRCGLEMEFGPVSAKVNNKVEGMHYRVYKRKDIEFMDL
ncbi:MAG: nucleoside kinase, partial [Prevotella sp.]|nr:nucleoside kinase [Prevotella sp.]